MFSQSKQQKKIKCSIIHELSGSEFHSAQVITRGQSNPMVYNITLQGFHFISGQ